MPLIKYFLYITTILIALTNGEINESQDEATQFDELVKQEHKLVVLFTQECCACTPCVEAEVLLGGMSKELEDNLGLLVVRLKSEEMKKRFNIKRLPSLLYIRNNKPAFYRGKFLHETLYTWLQNNIDPVTAELDDSSFEHLTQAASGATTGDWLVIFHDELCCKNQELIHLETAGIRLRNKVNVASVNTKKAIETKERFKIKSCPHVIFFRHQKLYRFSLPDITSRTLIRFAEGFYKNSKAETVPVPPSAFDKFLDQVIEFYKEHHYRVSLCLGFTLIFLSIFLLWPKRKPSTRNKSE